MGEALLHTLPFSTPDRVATADCELSRLQLLARVTMNETTPLLADVEDGRPSYVRASEDRDVKSAVDINGSPDDPQQWPASFKWSIVALLSFSAFSV